MAAHAAVRLVRRPARWALRFLMCFTIKGRQFMQWSIADARDSIMSAAKDLPHSAVSSNFTCTIFAKVRPTSSAGGTG